MPIPSLVVLDLTADGSVCMDAVTATSMRHLLEVGCEGCTVLAVMPQLQHVERYDLMVLVDEGRIVELESPAALLARDSEFEIIPCSGKRLASSLQIAGCAWDLQPT